MQIKLDKFKFLPDPNTDLLIISCSCAFNNQFLSLLVLFNDF